MKKKILLVTTTHTGCGHKSISDSLMDWLKEMPEIQVVQIDGFEQLVSKHVKTIGDSYGVVTRHAKFLWKWTWDFGTRFNDAYCDLMSTWSEKRFLEIIEREKPDVVLTTHPMFNSSLLSVCERNGLKLPFVSVQADPVTVHPSWCDPRAALTICATDEAAQLTRRYGVPKERILKIGFPTRRRFTDLAQKIDKLPYDPSRPARCLMMSGGEGSGMLGRYALALLSGTDAKLTIVCGRNKQLKKRLETLLKRKYGERVRILGFVTEIENLMLESDIMIARGSPNSFFEGIVMNVPLVITGALPVLTFVLWRFYADLVSDVSMLFIVPQALVFAAAAAWLLMLEVLYMLMVTYKLSFKQLLKNALVLVVARLPQFLGLRILTLAFPVALYVAFTGFPQAAVYMLMFGGFFYLVFGLALNRLLYASLGNAVCEKYINGKIGAPVDIGLRPKNLGR